MKKLILLLPIILLAFVNVTVNKKNVYPGEEVVLTIEATGNDIRFPNITKIGNFSVQGNAVTQNITILNGVMQKKVTKSYIFFPTKTVTVPSFEIYVDGKTYKTEPIKIVVTKPKQSHNPNYKLQIGANKTDVYIGEPIIFKIKYYQKANQTPQSIEIQKPDFNDFFSRLFNKREYQEGDFLVSEYDYLLISQKSGNYQIGPIMAKIGYLTNTSPVNDPFFNITASTLKYITVFSNSVKITSKPIPQDSIYGKFKASLSVDKTVAKADTPITATLKITGCGDFSDMPDFTLNVNNATLYPQKPILKTYIKHNSLCGEYIRKFTIVSDKDFTIKPLSFKAFDGKKVTLVKTAQIKIKILGSPKKSTDNIVEPQKIIIKKSVNYIYILLAFFVGLIIGFLSRYVKITKNEPTIIQKIKKANQKELFNLLLPYSNDSRIETILKRLERNIYNGENNKIDKKEIIKIIKDLENVT